MKQHILNRKKGAESGELAGWAVGAGTSLWWDVDAASPTIAHAPPPRRQPCIKQRPLVPAKRAARGGEGAAVTFNY